MRNLLRKYILLLALSMLPGNCIYAQDDSASKEFDYDKISSSAHARADSANQKLVIENQRLYVQITAGLYVVSLMIITFLMKITTHHAKDIVTVIGLVSVIFGTILVVLVVDTSESLTAPMGIFGAIAGYLFGTAEKRGLNPPAAGAK